MHIFNIHEAKTQLSRLVDQAARGEAFIIAKAGVPLVRVSALTSPKSSETKRYGFLKNYISVPEDFDRMGEGTVERLVDLPPLGGHGV